jgi:putative transposase
MCRVLGVSRSGYYAWQRRPVSAQEQRRTEVISEIHRIQDCRDMHAYGSPRMYRELLNRGYEVCENTVAKLMNSEGIRSSTSKKFRVNTTDSNHSLPTAENVLDRDFTASGPGQKLVSDLTYIRTDEGFLYLVCMIDVYSRRVVGWSMSHEMTTDVFLRACRWRLVVWA